MLEMHGISKIYRTDLIEAHALRNFSLKAGDGEFVAVTGPSGSGKTTFMNVAGLLETFETGCYRLDGQDVSKWSDAARSKCPAQKAPPTDIDLRAPNDHVEFQTPQTRRVRISERYPNHPRLSAPTRG